MDRSPSQRQHGSAALLAVLGLLVVVAAVGMVAAYRHYQNTLQTAQERHLVTMAQSASENIGGYFDARLHELDLQFGPNEVARAMVAHKNDAHAAVSDLLATFAHDTNAVGSIEHVPYDKALLESERLTGGDSSAFQTGLLATCDTWQAFLDTVQEVGTPCMGYWFRTNGAQPGEHDGYVMTLWQPVLTDTLGFIVETIDLDSVYDAILAPIQVGQQGYCTLKDPRRVIVMHKVRSQIGSNTVVDRVEGHPEGDWDELTSLQYSGQAGCRTVVSYWWDDVESGLTRKFIAYAPTRIGGSYFVTNVVMSYDELMQPLRAMLLLCTLLGAAIIALVTFGGWRLAKNIQDARHLERELAYERELVAQTQRVKLQEQQIQHIDRVQAMGLVATSVAHEIKNHVTPLLIYGQMLQVPALDDDERTDTGREIEKLSMRCAALLERMLAYAKKRPYDETGQDCATFNATAALHDAVSFVRPMCPRNVELHVDIDDRPCTLVGIETSIVQIVLNLATNALYAMRENGGTLHISWHPDPNTGAWILGVSDTGCGMDSEVRQRLFESFFTTKGDEGTGLGMSIIQTLVRDLGGSIEVESTPNAGSSFTVALPLAPRGLLGLNEVQELP